MKLKPIQTLTPPNEGIKQWAWQWFLGDVPSRWSPTGRRLTLASQVRYIKKAHGREHGKNFLRFVRGGDYYPKKPTPAVKV